jgi:glutathione synthase/RimK-type ligase-like ATP-grasp enzyme
VPTESSRPVVLLATWSDMPEGEEWTGTSHLPAAFAERGIDARWVVWDDPNVDWSAGLVAVRSTWDYERRREEFLEWARSVPWMLNSAAVFAWNTDKSYLPQLAASGVPVVPTVVVDGEAGLPAAIAEVSARRDGQPQAVVKPTVGAGGRGLVLVGGPAAPDGSGLGPGPWVVQPMVESVRTEGETSVFVLGGDVVSQAQKVPAAGEIRVHEQYGGTTVAVPLTEEATGLARRTVEVASSLLGETLDYARVDMMRLADGTLALGELEVTEPGLYLDVLPGNADAFADLVVARLGRG